MTALSQRRAATIAADPGSLRPWLMAGALAFALHAGAVMMLLVDGSKADSDENFGTSAMEVGIEDAAPSFDSTEAPTESDTASAVAAAAPSEAGPPPVTPTPTASIDNSEAEQQAAMVPREPAEQREHQAAVATSSAVASAASAAAPSRAAERERAQSVAAAVGNSAAARRAQATWQRGLVAHIERQKRYPADGAARSADIVVVFTINREGRLTAVEIAKGSGDARFDQAALEMMRRADPLPKPPSIVDDRNLSFRIPVNFRPGG